MTGKKEKEYEHGYGIFANMHFEEIAETLLAEGFWIRLHIVGRGQKTRWAAQVKIVRSEGMSKSEYKETPGVSESSRHLLTAARGAACKAYYGEPEITLGVKVEQ